MRYKDAFDTRLWLFVRQIAHIAENLAYGRSISNSRLQLDGDQRSAFVLGSYVDET